MWRCLLIHLHTNIACRMQIPSVNCHIESNRITFEIDFSFAAAAAATAEWIPMAIVAPCVPDHHLSNPDNGWLAKDLLKPQCTQTNNRIKSDWSINFNLLHRWRRRKSIITYSLFMQNHMIQSPATENKLYQHTEFLNQFHAIPIHFNVKCVSLSIEKQTQ